MADTQYQLTEFDPRYQVVVATLHEFMRTGESYIGPLHIGAYIGQDEIWLEREGMRVSFQAASLPALIKQLRRAAQATAQKDQP